MHFLLSECDAVSLSICRKKNNFGEGIALNRINNDVPRMITPEPPTPPPRPIDFFDHKDRLDGKYWSCLHYIDSCQ